MKTPKDTKPLSPAKQAEVDAVKQTNTIHWRVGDPGTVRVWRHGWFGDQFEVYDTKTWSVLKEQLRALGFRFEEHYGDDD